MLDSRPRFLFRDIAGLITPQAVVGSVSVALVHPRLQVRENSADGTCAGVDVCKWLTTRLCGSEWQVMHLSVCLVNLAIYFVPLEFQHCAYRVYSDVGLHINQKKGDYSKNDRSIYFHS